MANPSTPESAIVSIAQEELSKLKQFPVAAELKVSTHFFAMSPRKDGRDRRVLDSV